MENGHKRQFEGFARKRGFARIDFLDTIRPR